MYNDHCMDWGMMVSCPELMYDVWLSAVWIDSNGQRLCDSKWWSAARIKLLNQLMPSDHWISKDHCLNISWSADGMAAWWSTSWTDAWRSAVPAMHDDQLPELIHDGPCLSAAWWSAAWIDAWWSAVPVKHDDQLPELIHDGLLSKCCMVIICLNWRMMISSPS
jgi:hypothetical protein